MNGMNLLVLTNSSQVPFKSGGVSTQSTGESTFFHLLGQLVTPAVVDEPSLVVEGDGEIQEMLKKLLGQINLSEDELVDKKEIKDLLSLLPIEVQEQISTFIQMEEQNLQQVFMWPQIQQAVLVLINALASHPSKVDVNLYEFVSKFSGLDVDETDTTEVLIMKFKQFVEQKKSEGQLVFDIQMNKETERTVKNVKLPLFKESMVPQGLNLSPSGHELGQAMSRAEQATIHIGDRLPKEMQQQQFIRQFQSLIQRSVLNQGPAGLNTLSIKLFPAHLGRLDIQLTQVDGVITARILTGSATARELIEAQITQLRQAFNQQQIQVERIEIAQQYLGQERDEQSSGRNTKEDTPFQDKAEHEGDSEFQEFLEEASFNEQV
ncbi:flagellar hook-length control protein FliK [Alkalihalobacillus deserti]|uniref:flagellar hook-length control protein FliK n=1 Tax=Alkalihalobacillus deserti TaxID=2879466 RepID=UPI001D1372B8|nr:flagellar hook-length control protein FliK [Alkalihalobacillus deserti]